MNCFVILCRFNSIRRCIRFHSTNRGRINPWIWWQWKSRWRWQSWYQEKAPAATSEQLTTGKKKQLSTPSSELKTLMPMRASYMSLGAVSEKYVENSYCSMRLLKLKESWLCKSHLHHGVDWRFTSWLSGGVYSWEERWYPGLQGEILWNNLEKSISVLAFFFCFIVNCKPLILFQGSGTYFRHAL